MTPNPLAAAQPPTVAHQLLAAPHARTFAKTYVPPTPVPTVALGAFPAAAPPVTAVGVPRRAGWRAVSPIAATRGHGYSRNWAGAVVPATGGARFSLVTGSWTVPHVANPPGVAMSYASIWVGLGGTYRASNSMPQAGSEHGWDGKQPIHRLWCQWWLGPGRGTGYLSHWLQNATLTPGDPVTVWLEVHPPGTQVTFHWACGDTLYGASATGLAPVMADSANWIVERPTQVASGASGPMLGDRHPLPAFLDSAGTERPAGATIVTMTDCLARLGEPGTADTVRRPSDGALLSMRSVVPGASRSFVELEPAMTIEPNSNGLDIVRHLP